MSRVILYLEETTPLSPTIVMKVNDIEIRLNEHELDMMEMELLWIKESIEKARKLKFENLVKLKHVTVGATT